MKGEEAVVEDISELVSHSGNPTETLTNIVNLIQARFSTDVARCTCSSRIARTSCSRPPLDCGPRVWVR